MPAETLRFDNDTFDLVYGNGVLHHVDFMKTGYGVYRVLKPGGLAAFVEPLTYNPAIWLYRMMARSMRTRDERPLSAKDIGSFCRNHKGRRRRLSSGAKSAIGNFTCLLC